MHYHKSFFLIITFACCFIRILNPADAAAESFSTQQWHITADKLTRFENPASIIAEGNVILTKTEKTAKEKRPEEKGKDNWSDLLGADAADPRSDDEDTVATSTERDYDETAAEATAVKDSLAVSKSMPVIRDRPADSFESLSQEREEEENEQEKKKTVTVSKVMTTIKADWMVYDMDLGTVKMRGKVFIDIGPDQLTATSGTVNLSRETGTFENASIIRQYKDMHLEGRVVEKTGELTYHIEDGWIITCKLKDGEVPPWSFKAKDAEITDGGYAFLKHATFRIKDIPILYTPIMVLPAKRNRQTGFLFPLVSLSDRDGFGLETPFFINLSPSSDITLYPHYMAERGFMIGAEMRYILDEYSKGSVMGNFLADELNIDNNADYGYTHTNTDRYWYRGKADHEFGDWTTRLDFDVVSDLDYLREFDSGRTGLSMSDEYLLKLFGRGLQDKTVDRRKNQLVTLRSWNNGTSLKASLNGFDDLEEKEDGKNTSLWKLPELKYSGLIPVYESGVDFSWDADYVNYWREEGVGAQRVDLYPKLTTALPVLEQYLETTAGIGIRDTVYAIDDNGDEDWKDSDTENRFLAEFETEVSTTMRRDFALSGGELDFWSHTFRPFIEYKYVTEDDKDNVPVFDYVDSYGDQNRITYGVNNFFYVTGTQNGEESEREYGYIKIEQSYDLRDNDDEGEDEPFSEVEMRLAWYPLENINVKYKTDIDVYEGEFMKHRFEGDYLSTRGDMLSFDYLFYNNIDAEDSSSIRVAAQVGLLYNFFVGYSLEQYLEDSITVEEKFSIAYRPSCWSVELMAETTPDNEQVMIMFQLANIGAPLGLDLMSGD